MAVDKRIQAAIISGASHALQFKERRPQASEQEIIKFISDKMEEIAGKIDKKL